MSSEWMKVMLDEIARKKAEASQAQIELERRRAEQAPKKSEGGSAEPEVPPPPPRADV